MFNGSMLTFFTADILTCNSRESTGVANNINNDSSIQVSRQCDSTNQDPETDQLKFRHLLLFTAVLFLL